MQDQGQKGGGTPPSVPSRISAPLPPGNVPAGPSLLHHLLGTWVVKAHAAGRTWWPVGARHWHGPSTPNTRRPSPCAASSLPPSDQHPSPNPPVQPPQTAALATLPKLQPPPLPRPPAGPTRAPWGVSLVWTPVVWATGRSCSRGSPALRVLGLPQPLEHLGAGVSVPDVLPGRPDVRAPLPRAWRPASLGGRLVGAGSFPSELT